MNENVNEIHKKDRKICIKLIHSCLLEVNSKNYSSQYIKYLLKSYSKYFMKRRDIFTIVMKKDEIIIGIGSISEQGQIRDVFIDVENHRKGYGKKIIEELEKIAKSKSLKNLFLYSAISAVGFYEKLEYVKVGGLDHGDDNIEIKMEKKLELN